MEEILNKLEEWCNSLKEVLEMDASDAARRICDIVCDMEESIEDLKESEE